MRSTSDPEEAQALSNTAMSDARKLEEAGDGAEDASAPLQQIESSSEGFQHIMKAVGDLGRWQWKLFIVTSSCGIFTAFHNLAAGKSWVTM